MGVFVGLMGSDFADGQHARTDMSSMLGSAGSVIAGRLSHWLASNGPSMLVDTACSSSLVALSHAVDSIRLGRCRAALVAGVNFCASEKALGQRANGGMLSPDGVCHTFDVTASGYARADGCVVVVVAAVPASDRRPRIAGIAVNHSGRSASLTAPNGEAHVKLLAQCLAATSSSSADKNGRHHYWETHGTGTLLGDPIEMNALTRQFRSADSISLGAIKANLGHGEAAAGLTALLKSALVLENDYIPSQLHVQLLNDKIAGRDVLRLPIVGEESRASSSLSAAGTSSFGVSGTNAAVLLRRPNVSLERRRRRPSKPCCPPLVLLPLVADSVESLARLMEDVQSAILHHRASPLSLSSAAVRVARRRDLLSAGRRLRACIVLCSSGRVHSLHTAASSRRVLLNYSSSPGDLHFYNLSSSKDCRLSLGQALARCIESLESARDEGSELTVDLLMFSLAKRYVNGCTLKWSQLYEIDEDDSDTSAWLPLWPMDEKLYGHPKASTSPIDHPTLGSVTSCDQGTTEFTRVVMTRRQLKGGKIEKSLLIQLLVSASLTQADVCTTISDIQLKPPRTESKRNERVLIKSRLSEKRCEVYMNGDLIAVGARTTSTSLQITTQNVVEKKQLKLRPWYCEDCPRVAFDVDDSFSLIRVSCLRVEDALGAAVAVLEHFWSTADPVSIVCSQSLPKQFWITRNGMELEMCNDAGCRLLKFHLHTNGLRPTPNGHVRQVAHTQGTNERKEKNHENKLTETIIAAVQSVSPIGLDNDDLRNRLDDSFADLGLDSLAVVDMINQINKMDSHNELRLTVADAIQNNTIRQLAHAIERGSTDERMAESKATVTKLKTTQQHDSLMYSIEEDVPVQLNNDTIDYSIFLDDTPLRLRPLKMLCRAVSVERNLRVSFHSESRSSPRDLFLLLKHIVLRICKWSTSKLPPILLHSTNPRVLAFLKSASAEKFPQIAVEWHCRLQSISTDPPAIDRSFLRATCWLITGGLRGIGLEMGRYLSEHCHVSKLILLGRSRPNESLLAEFKSWRCEVQVAQLAVTNGEGIRELIRSNRLDGVIHSAGAIADCRLEEQTDRTFDTTWDPKVDGAQALLWACEASQQKLRWFVVNSSAAAVLGNKGQCNYAMANASFLQRPFSTAAPVRVSCIHWANWADVGMAVQMNDRLRQQGLVPIEIPQAMQCLLHVLRHQLGRVLVANFNVSDLLRSRPDIPARVFEEQPARVLPPQHRSDCTTTFEHLLILKTRRCDVKDALMDSRISMDQLRAVFASSSDEPQLLLYGRSRVSVARREGVELEVVQSPDSGRRPSIVFMCSGQGSQQLFMGSELASAFPVFRTVFLSVLRQFDALLELDDKLENIVQTPSQFDHLSSDTRVAQPLCFAHSMAAGRLWKSFVRNPDACNYYYVGHSVGELAAAVLGGFLRASDALRLVACRAKVLHRIRARGAMLAVHPTATQHYLSEPSVHLAASNSPQQDVVAGPIESLEALVRSARQLGLPSSAYINLHYPFHTPIATDHDLQEYRDLCDSIQFPVQRDATLAINLTGDLVHQLTPSILYDQLTRPIRFVDSIRRIHERGGATSTAVWLDLGSDSTLASFVRRTLPACAHSIVTTTSKKHFHPDHILRALPSLHAVGIPIDWHPGDRVPSVVALERRLTNSEATLVDQHRLKSLALVPAALQLEIISDAIRKNARFEQAALELFDIRIPHPWHFNEQTQSCTVSWENGTTRGAQIRPDTASNHSIVCQYRSILLSDSDGRESTYDWRPSPIPVMTTELSSADFYKNSELKYGDDLRLLNCHPDLIIDKKTAVFGGTACQSWLLVEAALQSLAVIASIHRKDSHFVPIRISSVKYLATTTAFPTEFKTYASLKKISDTFLEGDACVRVDDTVVVEIRRVSAVIIKNSGTDSTNGKVCRDPSVQKVQCTPSSGQADVASNVFIVGHHAQFCGPSAENRHIWETMKIGKQQQQTTTTMSRRRKNSGLQLPDGIGLLDHDIARFDASFFGVNPREAVFMDPQHRLLMESTQRALENSALVELPESTAVFVALSSSDFAQLAFANFPDPSGYLVSGSNASCAAGRLARWLGAKGPAMTIDTACSSFGVALKLAHQSLVAGECLVAVVGAVNLVLTDKTTTALRNAGIVGQDGDNGVCRSMDVHANGYWRAEAVGTVILARQPSTIAAGRRLTQLLAPSVVHVGRDGAGIVAPSGRSERRVMESALGNVSSTQSVDIMMHCAGTMLGDKVELSQVVGMMSGDRSAPAHLHAPKAVFGHTEAASGLASLVAALESHRHGYRPAIVHLRKTITQVPASCSVSFIGEECERDEDGRLCLVNCFGFSGTNSCFAVRLESLSTSPPPNDRPPMLVYAIAVSGTSEHSLRRAERRMKRCVHQSKESLRLISAASLCRKHYDLRAVLFYTYTRRLIGRIHEKKEREPTEILLDARGPARNWSHLFEEVRLHFRSTQSTGLPNWETENVDDALRSHRFHAVKNLLDRMKVPTVEGGTTGRRVLALHQLSGVLDIFTVIAVAFCQGVNIDWSDLTESNPTPSPGVIPGYSFHRSPCWPPQFQTSISQKTCKQLRCYSRTLTSSPLPIEAVNQSPRVVWHHFDWKSQLASSIATLPLPGVVAPLTKATTQIGANCKQIHLLLYVGTLDWRTVCIESFLQEMADLAIQLRNIWHRLLRQRTGSRLCVSVDSDVLLGVTALLRSLAAETTSPVEFIVVRSTNWSEVVAELNSFPYHPFEVITYTDDGARLVERVEERNVDVSDDMKKRARTILCTGGQGGLGRAFAEHWQPSRCYTIGRSSSSSSAPSTTHFQGDCSDADILSSCLKRIDSPSLDCALHCAGLVENRLSERLDSESLLRVLRPKVGGILALLRQLPNSTPLVAISSVAAVFGSAGQANYAFANELMTRILLSVKQTGSRVLSLGPISDVGLIAPHLKHVSAQILGQGYEFMQSSDVTPFLDATSFEPFERIVAKVNWTTILERNASLKALLSSVTHSASVPRRESQSGSELSRLTAIVEKISGLKLLSHQLDQSLMDLGLDSLMLEQLRNDVNRWWGTDLSSIDMYDNCTARKLLALLPHLDEAPPPLDPITANCNNAPKGSEDPGKDWIAIIGASASASGASTIDEIWRRLEDAEECITFGDVDPKQPEWIPAGGLLSDDVARFDEDFWKLSPSTCAEIDSQIRQFVQHTYWAMESSDYTAEQIAASNVGVWAGAEPSQYGMDSTAAAASDGSLAKMYALNQNGFLATWTAHLLNLRGPAISVYSACSTALTAIAQAADALRNRAVDIAVAGAASLIPPDQRLGHRYEKGQVLSADGHCRPFSADASGTVRGSAVGCFVLKRLADARQDGDRILAVIRGYSVTNDGLSKASFMAPSRSGQQQCMVNALRNAKLAPHRIDYIECHGTGTTVGDEIEVAAIRDAYGRDTHVWIGSTKANFGHGFAASAVVGLVKLLKVIETRKLPKQIHVSQPLPVLKSTQLAIPSRTVDLDKKPDDDDGGGPTVAISAFGIGGTNVHMILQSGDGRQERMEVGRNDDDQTKQWLLPVSGHSKEACQAMCINLANYIMESAVDDSRHLTSISMTLIHRRTHYPWRAIVVATSCQDAVEKLRVASVEQSRPITANDVVFFFGPQGSQYSGMEAEALEQCPVFRTTLLEHCATVDDALGSTGCYSILSERSDEHDDQLRRVELAQAATFSVCDAIRRQLQDWGVPCGMTIGHSAGEFGAAVHGQAIDATRALRLLIERAKLVARTPAASMIAVECANEIPEIPTGIYESAILAPTLRCYVGELVAMERFVESLQAQGHQTRTLSTSRGFHSPLLQDVATSFGETLSKCSFNALLTPMISTVDGGCRSVTDASYWLRHFLQPVRLDLALETLYKDREQHAKIIVQIGARGILEELVKRMNHSYGLDIIVVNTCASEKQSKLIAGAHSMLVEALARLWQLGVAVDWTKWRKACATEWHRVDVNLPRYSFGGSRHWKKRPVVQEDGKRLRRHELYKQCRVLCDSANDHPASSLPFKHAIVVVDVLDEHVTLQIARLRKFVCSCKTILVSFTDQGGGFNISTEDGLQRLQASLMDSLESTLVIQYFGGQNFDPTGQARAIARTMVTLSEMIRRTIQQRQELIGWISLIRGETDLSSASHWTIFASQSSLANSTAVERNLVATTVLIETELQPDWTKILKSVIVESKAGGGPFAFVGDRRLCSLAYGKIYHEPSACQSSPIRTMLVFGGWGPVGRCIIRAVLEQAAHNRTVSVYVMSRNAKLKEAKMQTFVDRYTTGRQQQAVFTSIDGDVRREGDVDQAVQTVLQSHGHLDMVVHAAGLAPSNAPLQEQLDGVMDSKVTGALNILKIASMHALQADLLLLTSSLSAVLGLVGAEVYAAASAFLDSLVKSRHPSFKRIVSLQLPPVVGDHGDGMFSTTSRLGSSIYDSLLGNGAIDMDSLTTILPAAFQQSGTIALSNEDPLIIKREVRMLTLAAALPSGQDQTDRHETEADPEKDPILSAWQNVLRFGARPKECLNFYEIGGNSLNALEIVHILNDRLAISLTVNDLLDHPSLDDFRAIMDEKVTQRSVRDLGVNDVDLLDGVQLSYPQESMYFLSKVEVPGFYNIVYAMTFRGESFSVAAFRCAMLRLIARQTSLRTAYRRSPAGVRQHVQSLTSSYYRLSFSPRSNGYFRKAKKKALKFHFDLDCSSVWLQSCGLPDGRMALMISKHHICTDGWSMTVFANELSQRYNEFDREGKAKEKKLCFTVANFAVWQRQNIINQSPIHEIVVEDKADRIASSPPSRFRPTTTTQEGEKREKEEEEESESHSRGRRHVGEVVSYDLDRLRRLTVSLAAQHQCTEFAVILSALARVLHRFAGGGLEESDPVVIGCPEANRPLEETRHLVGYFLNNLVLCVDRCSSGHSFTDTINATREELVGARSQHVPYNMLVAALNRRVGHAQSKPFYVYLNMRDELEHPRVRLGDAVESSVRQYSVNAAFEMMFTIDDTSDGRRLSVHYDRALFRRHFVQTLIRECCLQLHLAAAVRGRFVERIDSIAVVGPAVDVPRLTSSQLVDLQASRTPNSVAVLALDVDEDNGAMLSSTFEQFQSRVRQQADALQEHYWKSTGVSLRPDSIVPLLASNETQFWLLHAVAAHGGCYAPIDVGWPELRKTSMLRRLPSSVCPLSEQCSFPVHNGKLKRSFWRTTPLDLAYILHTSGSTGIPKACAVQNSNLSSFIRCSSHDVLISPGRIGFQSVNMVFDLSQMNIFSTLTYGGTIQLAVDLRNAAEEVQESDATTTFLTSAYFNSLSEAEMRKLGQLERLIIGGETIQEKNLTTMLEWGGDLVQMYGPTESTVWSLTNRIKMERGTGGIIGRAVSTESCRIVSPNSPTSDCSPYEHGELWLSGPKTSRGYCNQVGLDRFVEYARNGERRRFYRTGDIVCIDGNRIRFIGRRDFQIKVRGHRVELAEIEQTVVSAVPNITLAVVELISDRLVLFVQHADSTTPHSLDYSLLSTRLSERLPHYMVPQDVVCLERMPLNSNGKIDRAALRLAHKPSYRSDGGRSIQSERRPLDITEQRVVACWSRVLPNAEKTAWTPSTSFVSVGGHSLLLLQLQAHLLDEFGLSISITALLEHSTIQQQAELIVSEARTSCNRTTLPKKSLVSLREVSNPEGRLFLIHPIGGSIYSYFALATELSHHLPAISIYAIPYALEYEAKSLRHLAKIYANQIRAYLLDDNHRPLFIGGHSMGGIIAREVAAHLAVLGIQTKFVLMIDSFRVGTEQLDVDAVKAQIEDVFRDSPNCAEHSKKAVRLAEMLRSHRFSAFTMPIVLVKARRIGRTVLRSAIRPDLDDEQLAGLRFNGWQSTVHCVLNSSTPLLRVLLVEGDHDSLLDAANLSWLSSHVAPLIRQHHIL